MKVKLTPLQMQQLCDMRDKVGAGDLLDFIHWVQRTARKNEWTVEHTLEVCEYMPVEEADEAEL